MILDYTKLGDKQTKEMLNKYIRILRPLFKPLGKSKSGDWLDSIDEKGQSFEEYTNSKPRIPRTSQRTIYIQPLGDFTDKERKIITLSSDFMRAFFGGLPIIIEEDLPIENIPSYARRINEYTSKEQLLTTYILLSTLLSRFPKDAVAYIAFTKSDLWPGEGWNFVFGQASLKYSVGVWSFHRYGNPNNSMEEFLLCLLRTMKTGAHETAHLFSLPHCTACECAMNGAMSLEEDDRKPLFCCPDCMAKICWAIKVDPITRYLALEKFCRKQSFYKEAEKYQDVIDVLRKI